MNRGRCTVFIHLPGGIGFCAAFLSLILASCAPLPPEPTDPVREARCREPTRAPDKLEGKRVAVCPQAAT
jgi:hypothetical protein